MSLEARITALAQAVGADIKLLLGAVASKIDDAPSDSKLYGRYNGLWTEVSAGTGGSGAGLNASVQGPVTVYINQAVDYTITDFDSFSSYVVSVSAGSVARFGPRIEFVAPPTSGNVTMTVFAHGVARTITITVMLASVAAPEVLSPADREIDVKGPATTITTGAFVWLGMPDTHLDTDWELWSGPGRTGALLASSLADTSNKTSWTPMLQTATTYYLAVRYRGAANGAGAWSAHSRFTTAPVFNSYIEEPAPTPEKYGAPFEGGFFAGLIWNQLMQSADSKTIAAGMQTFTVPDMTTAPLVYAGQMLEVRSRANPDNKMVGTVTGAIGTTLTLDITSVGGTGTFADWSIMARYRVIVAPKASGENTSVMYKSSNGAAPAAAGTLTEGHKATLAMVGAGTSSTYPAAHWCNSLSIGGKTDWYLPARDELELCWRNLKPVTSANHTATDRPTGATPNYQNLGSYGGTEATPGLNKNSDPASAAYTGSVPAQTSAAAFQTGGAEAYHFATVFYWSSSEYSAAGAWCQFWSSSYPGRQQYTDKASAGRVRAVRRSII